MGTYQIGEMTPSMTKQFEKGFQQCVKNNEHRRAPYYILYTANWFKGGEELRDVFRSSAKCLPRMLNTMCWKIDNKTGECKEMWVLPKDAPIQPVETDGVIESVANSAKGMPIIYN